MKPISVTKANIKETAIDKYYIDKTNIISKIINSEDEQFYFVYQEESEKHSTLAYYITSFQIKKNHKDHSKTKRFKRQITYDTPCNNKLTINLKNIV